MMEHNEQDILQPLNIITTDNRTLDISVDGVIPGSSLNIPLNNLDNDSNVKNSSPYKIPSSYENFKIGTLNVKSECNHKMIDILHKMTQHNIHILFVNELNITLSYDE